MSELSTSCSARPSWRAGGAALDAGFGLLALALAGLGLQATFGLGAGYLAKALLAYALGAGLVLATLPRVLARRPLGAANRVTGLRLVLVALLAALLGEPPVGWLPAALALLALALDGADGWLARRLGTSSGFGARFDMETDAALIAVLALLVWQLDKAGAWVVLAGALRYLFVAAAHVWPALGAELPPSRRRQTVCVVQVVALLVCLLPPVQPPQSALVAGVSLVLLAGSFFIDVRWLLARAHPTAIEEG